MRKFASYGPAFVVFLCVLVALFVAPGIVERYAYAQQSAKITLARSVLAQDDILRRVDRAISAIANAIEPSVVHIETQFSAFSSDPNSTSERRYSTGAGWVYDKQGHVVTNAHVVQGAKVVSIEFFDGHIVRGDVIGIDPYTDIAVIRADQGGSYFAARRATDRLPRTGERVYAFGSPFGFKFSMSEGIISGLGREAAGSNVPGGYTNYIQTDAAVNPGNSGGPLVNADGHVIGMNVAIATAKSVGQSPEDSGSDSAGISFAIPLGTIEPIVNQIIKYGKVSRGYLGINYGGRRSLPKHIPMPDGTTLTGIEITGVETPGPSSSAGLRKTDIIVAIEGSPIINAESLLSLISSSRAGDTIRVRIYRDGEIDEIPVVLGKMKNSVLTNRIAIPIMMQLGMSIQPMDDLVTIRSINPGFPGSDAGFRQGDVIIAVNDKAFGDYFDFFVLIADEGILTGSPIHFSAIGIDGKQREIMIQLKR